MTLDQLKKKFVSMDSEPRNRKKVRVAFVYLLAGFVMAQDPSKSIYPYYFQIVIDLELLNRFPWVMCVHPGRLLRFLRYESTNILTSKSLTLKDILEDPEVH